jgi:hypothetical protein
MKCAINTIGRGSSESHFVTEKHMKCAINTIGRGSSESHFVTEKHMKCAINTIGRGSSGELCEGQARMSDGQGWLSTQPHGPTVTINATHSWASTQQESADQPGAVKNWVCPITHSLSSCSHFLKSPESF